jgi:hypothetical protein
MRRAELEEEKRWHLEGMRWALCLRGPRVVLVSES